VDTGTLANALMYRLTRKVGAEPLRLCAAGFGGKDPLRAARRLTDQLSCAGLVTLRRTTVAEKHGPVLPLIDYHPGDPEPDFEAVAKILATRWDGPRIGDTFVVATRRASKRYGGAPGSLRSPCVDHDDYLAAVFLSLDAKEQRRWARGEDTALGRCGQDVPDAVLRGRKAAADVVIEIGGTSYGVEKLARRHRQWCACSYRLY
jgi:hypothetical protein